MAAEEAQAHRRGRGRPPYSPTEKDAKYVESMAACGFTQEEIAKVVGVAPKALRKHFRDILDTAALKADAKVAANLFTLATSPDNPAAAFFGMKCRRRWRESSAVEISGSLSLHDLRAAMATGEKKARAIEDSDELPITE